MIFPQLTTTHRKQIRSVSEMIHNTIELGNIASVVHKSNQLKYINS